MAILYGIGRPDFLTSGLTQEKLLPIEPMEFELAGESEKKESRKFVDGELVTAGSMRSATTYTMRVNIEAVNWMALQFAYGELAGITPSVALPELRYGRVPTSAPFEVTDADITTTAVQCSVTQRGAWGEARPLTRRTAAGAVVAGEFGVDTANTKLLFHSSQAGAPFAYRLFKTYTNLASIGAEAVFEAFSSFSFSGLLYTDEEKIKIVIDKISASNVPSINVADTTTLELEYDLVAVGAARRPFKLYKMADGYQP